MEVAFRQIEREDLPMLRDWRNLEKVRKYCREYRWLNMVDQERWFEKASTNKVNDMFLVLANDEPIGVCGLTHINWKDRSAEVSFYLSKTMNSAIEVAIGIEVYKMFKKKGFDEYNLNRLWGEAYSFNQGGISLALLCGFKEEGVLRQTVFWDGKYFDSVIVSMLAEEYRKAK
jgi:hypothetical protein